MMAEATVEFSLDPHEEDEERQEEEDPEDTLSSSTSSSIHRIQSESTIRHNVQKTVEITQQDVYTFLERSQSDDMLSHNNCLDSDDDDLPDHHTLADSSRNVSECNKVYLDLSRAEPFERVEFADSVPSMFRSSSGRQLETIPQDEELKTEDMTLLYASQRSFSSDSRGSSQEDVSGLSRNKMKSSNNTNSSRTCQDSLTAATAASITGSSRTNLKSCVNIYSNSLKQKIRTLQMGSIPEQVNALQEMNVLMDQAWSMPVYGKELAYTLCDILRVDKALDIVVNNLSCRDRDLLTASAKLLEQSLTTDNRLYVAGHGLETVVRMACEHKGDAELAACITGILESLFKTTEEACSRVVKLGGLNVIIYWCRGSDRVVLKHCAIALSNLALYGGPDNQLEMTRHKAPEWLFPLALVDEDSVRYYALLAMAVLASNKELEAQVVRSSTLSLILPFIRTHDPQDFALRDSSHQHGRSVDWLQRLVPMLGSKREEAQALAAFHMVMEAGVKAEQDNKEALYDTGAVDTLKRLASTPNCTASRLAAQALAVLGEEVPDKLSHQVPLWSVHNVGQWVTQVGFSDYGDVFRSCQVDGDLLLRMSEKELVDSIGITCAVSRKRFLREVRDLKLSADYTSCDPSRLSQWLEEVGPVLLQYTYPMLQAGVDRQTLARLTHHHLQHDCAIHNGIHRMKIIDAIEELRCMVSSPTTAPPDGGNGGSTVSKQGKTPIDVFISYRRSTGSHLASLLKVHLELRGLSVFIDIERLPAGKFDEGLLHSLRQADNLLVVLTPNALDRCVGDTNQDDWVHKEIVTAMENGANVVPLMDTHFHWPPSDTLPSDLENLHTFNGVRWIHDYQDACVDKVVSFLRGGHGTDYNLHHHHLHLNNNTSTTPTTSSSSRGDSSVDAVRPSSLPDGQPQPSLASDTSKERSPPGRQRTSSS